MRRGKLGLLGVVLGVAVLVGCAGTDPAKQAETPATQDLAGNTGTDGSDDAVTLPDLTEERPVAYPPCVKIDGTVYQETGYVSSMAGCGVMDGEITSQVPGSELPTEDNQSNFGTGYGYQFGTEGLVLVKMDGQMQIFQDIDSTDRTIPAQVLHFTAEVKDVEESTLLVTAVATAEGFHEMPKADYVVSKDNLQGEVQTGDLVEIWCNGMILETNPAQLGVVYRIEKTE